MRIPLVKTEPQSAPNTVFLAKVKSFDINSRTASVSIIDDSRTIYNCQIACSIPTSYEFGLQYIPSYQEDGETEYKMSSYDIYCVACWLSKDYVQAVILGFLPPRQTELSIPEYGLYLFRHESDVIFLVRADGTTEFYHPSGSYIKIGENDTNVATSSISSDGLYPSLASDFRVWDPEDYNSQKQVGIFIRCSAGQRLNLNSDGTIDIITSNDVNVTANTNVNVTANTINLIKKV